MNIHIVDRSHPLKTNLLFTQDRKAMIYCPIGANKIYLKLQPYCNDGKDMYALYWIWCYKLCLNPRKGRQKFIIQ